MDKVTGRQRYLGDRYESEMLHAAVKTSPHAYAKILSVNLSKALEMPGVHAILTGEDHKENFGLYLGDKPPLARSVVRHHGEPVAAVVADTLKDALAAVERIEVTYEPMTPVRSPSEALATGAPLLHPEMASYPHIPAILPEPGSNVANRTKIRKGNVENGFEEAEVIIEASFAFPPGDHVAMEPRAAIARIHADGEVEIHSTTQAPFVVKGLMSVFFGIDEGKINVIAPPIGGGFGGKAGIQLEGLVYLLSRAVGGRPVRLVNTREQDLLSSPGNMGLEATVKLGAKKDGTLVAADLTYLFDSGAYADYAVNISRAAAISCTGPYRIPNVRCDSVCVYTNHPFATAYRGFGHVEVAFAIERAMDLLADEAEIDPVTLRLVNAVVPGDTTPVQSLLDANTGNLPGCIQNVAEALGWKEGNLMTTEAGLIRAKGVTCLWKAPAMPTNTDAGAILTFNGDGSVNLQTGIVEIGQGTKTGLAQIVAERLGLEMDQVHVQMIVDTKVAPHDWATAASRGLFMAGRAALEACDDALGQIRRTASIALRVSPEDLTVRGGRVFLEEEPHVGLSLKDVALGYVYPGGNAVEGQIIGRGRYISRLLTGIDPDTGEGHPDLEWTLAAQGVEVEFDPADGSYRILKAACCLDAGRVINPDLARGQIAGAMAMGLGFAACEGFVFNSRGQVQNDDLRDFKILRIGEAPIYHIAFLETPQRDGPFGARGLGEQAVIGMPGALASALSRAAGTALNTLPLTPESIWKAMRGDVHDRV
jgi:CO/xanthine dehydrogenase Mo-binding subunit